jgi:hypothetical protein
MWDERVNDAIDEVARQTTALAPPDLRRAVMARITGAAGRRSPFAVRRWVMVPLAAAAAIVIAIVVGRDRDVRHGNSAAPQARVAPDTTEAPAQRREPETAASAAAEAAPPLRSSAARDRLVASANGDARVLEPAVPVDSIAVAPLTVDVLTTDAMQMERLEAVASIVVAPLDPTDIQRRYE